MKTKARRIAVWVTVLAAVVALAGIVGWRTLVTDKTDGSSDLCELHRLKMDKVIVPIVWGLPSNKIQRQWSFAAALFPHGATRIYGGCIPGSAEWARVFRCPDCYAVRQQWLERWNTLTEPQQIAEAEVFAEKQRKISNN